MVNQHQEYISLYFFIIATCLFTLTSIVGELLICPFAEYIFHIEIIIQDLFLYCSRVFSFYAQSPIFWYKKGFLENSTGIEFDFHSRRGRTLIPFLFTFELLVLLPLSSD